MKTSDNKSQHAPGPWTYMTYIEDDAGYYLSSPSYGNFAVVHKSGRPDTVEMDAANARLIAAAPELLQALKLLVDCIDGNYKEAGDFARTVIEKAEVRK